MGKIILGEIEMTPQQEVETVSGNVETLSSTTTAHTADTTAHVTAADKTAWNAKAETSDIPSVTAYADSVKYNSTTHYVEFYHGTTAGTKVYEYDASPFLVDGMVDDVRIENGNLVIDFNTASGKQDISIPLTDIFNPANYYTTAQTSGATELSTAFAGKSDTGHTHLLSGVTDVTAPLAGINSITGAVGTMAFQNAASYSSATQVNTALGGKADTATTLAGYGITDAYAKSETSGATELSTAFGAKLDATAYTPTDLSNYYQKSETSGKTEISTALSGKSNTGHTHSQYLTDITSSDVTYALGFTPANNTNFKAHTADTSAHGIQVLLNKIAVLENAVFSIDGHRYVELGLPSGTKWATMNVGASSETGYGNIYQYGKGTAQYAATSGQSDYSGTENPLNTSVDTARQAWGGQWHMPTSAQFEELTANTTFTWETNFNGSDINGAKFTAQNGNYIFFPAAGTWINGYCNNTSRTCGCWTSTPEGASNCYTFEAFNGSKFVSLETRNYGLSVRGVVG